MRSPRTLLPDRAFGRRTSMGLGWINESLDLCFQPKQKSAKGFLLSRPPPTQFIIPFTELQITEEKGWRGGVPSPRNACTPTSGPLQNASQLPLRWAACRSHAIAANQRFFPPHVPVDASSRGRSAWTRASRRSVRGCGSVAPAKEICSDTSYILIPRHR